MFQKEYAGISMGLLRKAKEGTNLVQNSGDWKLGGKQQMCEKYLSFYIIDLLVYFYIPG